MSLKAKLEAIIYAAETPITLNHIIELVGDSVAAEGATEEEVRSHIKVALEELIDEYAAAHRGIEIRHIAGGYRMSTKPEHHDMVRSFAKSLKPPIRLSMPALETLAVIAYKQPVTVPEISEIRGVDSSGVIATLLERKLITTAGRKAVIGRPILYKSTKEFLLRFGLKDVSELPSMEEFEKLVAESFQSELQPVAEDSAETISDNTAEVASNEVDSLQVETTTEVIATEEEIVSVEPPVAGEKDPAA
jgi:segregation and condensation protein B